MNVPVHQSGLTSTVRSSARPSARAALALMAGLSMAVARPTATGRAAQLPWALARSAGQFAAEVLGAAPLPHGARPWPGALPKVLAEPPVTAAATVDHHRSYVVSALSASGLREYVPAHLTGAKWEGGGVGGAFYTAWAQFSLPVRGPHQYSASLEYSLAGSTCQGSGSPGPPCLLRVDALTVWEPSRPADEVAPATDRGTLTAYAYVSPAGVPSRATTISLTARQSAEIVRQFDALPLGPAALCHGDAVVYKLALRPAAFSGPRFTVTGQACAAVVQVSVGGRSLQPLYDWGCALLRLVRRFAPARANGTREAAVGCAHPESGPHTRIASYSARLKPWGFKEGRSMATL